MVMARPTLAADMPTTWVRKTALPVLKAPSPVEKSTDCVASRRDMGVGGTRRRRKPGRDPEREVVITGILVGGGVVVARFSDSPSGGAQQVPDPLVDRVGCAGWVGGATAL